MKKRLILAGSIVLMLACTKTPKIQPQAKESSNSSGTNHNTTLRESPVKGNRTFHAIGQGDVITEAWCSSPAGSCLDDVEIVESSSEMYTNLMIAIETNTQAQFFATHDYAEVYSIDHKDWVQSGLESGELQIIVVSNDGIDYHVFVQSDYKELPMEKLFKHMSFVVPVNI